MAVNAERFHWPGRVVRKVRFWLSPCLTPGLTLLCLWLCPLPGWSAPPRPSTSVDFSQHIRPILAEKCRTCHGGDQPKGGLDLGDRAKALAAGDSGVMAIVPHKPLESELIRRILSSDPDQQMPPPEAKPLTSQEIALLRQWVEEGAGWSLHWAFRPLAVTLPPDVESKAGIRNPIDRFVLAQLERQQGTPSPEALPHILVKRLYYDLIGLPPPSDVVAAFTARPTEGHYQQIVDQLLASPHFGERWGRHWLDLAHFADSDGYEKDRPRPDAYIYRDWVIAAFNQDMPFDQFTIEQLAGDLLPNTTAKQRIATGFLRQTLTNEEGGVDQEEYRVAACFDRTETVGTIWLGLTIGCVRCHAHKYDPFPHDDFYKLFAFFNDGDEITSRLPVAASHLDELQQKLAPLEAALTQRYSELAGPEADWERQERERVMAQSDTELQEHPASIARATSASTPDIELEIDGAQVHHPLVKRMPDGVKADEAGGSLDKDSYTLDLEGIPGDVTGLKLYAVPDRNLPNQGPGLAANGNFVITRMEAFVVGSQGSLRPLQLQRAKADYAQTGFPADAVLPHAAELAPGESSGREKTGWAIDGKLGVEHWIQLRTREPITLAAGESLRLVVHQQYGDRHVIGTLRVMVLTGQQRGLHIPPENIADALEMYPEKRVARVRQELFDYYVSNIAADERVIALRRQIDQVQREFQAQLMDIRTYAKARQRRETHVFHRGDFLTPAHAVRPGVPAVLARFAPRSEMGDRLDLARWFVDEENFLTPRVAVNHVWQHLFGLGLVRTPNDFGTRGESPTHPELLDWLSHQFQHDLQWSRKKLIRLIVTSSTYRQASTFRPEMEQRDPRNTLIFRQNRFRVESEIVRDLHLAVAGLLSLQVGGPSVFPPMPADLAKLSYANNFTWNDSTRENRYRRGMYTFFKRTIPHPNLMTFDSPDANVACVARTVSNTPLQALSLLNNEVHAEAAQALAQRLLDRAVKVDAVEPKANERKIDDRQLLEWAMRLCLGRPGASDELDRLTRLLNEARAYYAQHSDDARDLTQLHPPLSAPREEAAAWVVVARTMLNLDEFITRE